MHSTSVVWGTPIDDDDNQLNEYDNEGLRSFNMRDSDHGGLRINKVSRPVMELLSKDSIDVKLIEAERLFQEQDHQRSFDILW